MPLTQRASTLPKKKKKILVLKKVKHDLDEGVIVTSMPEKEKKPLDDYIELV